MALVQTLARPAVATGPERACRTGGSFVMDALFVWTADDSVRHYDGPCSGRVDEREHFFRNAGIVADICLFGEPASKIRNGGTFSRHDADGDRLGRRARQPRPP